MKQFTGYNDLARRACLGQEGLDHQVRALAEGMHQYYMKLEAEWIEQQQRS